MPIRFTTTVKCRNESSTYLVVTVVPDLDLVEAVPGEDGLPLVPGDEGRSVHGSAVADDEAVPVGAFGKVEEGVLHLQHRLQEILLNFRGLNEYLVVSLGTLLLRPFSFKVFLTVLVVGREAT